MCENFHNTYRGHIMNDKRIGMTVERGFSSQKQNRLEVKEYGEHFVSLNISGQNGRYVIFGIEELKHHIKLCQQAIDRIG